MLQFIRNHNFEMLFVVFFFQDTVNLMVLIFVDDTPVSDKNISEILITLDIITYWIQTQHTLKTVLTIN